MKKLSNLKKELQTKFKSHARASSLKCQYHTFDSKKEKAILEYQHYLEDESTDLIDDFKSYQKSNSLSKLKEKKEINNHIKLKEKVNEEINNNPYQDEILNKVQIIGITGSRGKSTTAYLVHEYLQRIGKKSILYSSIKIDSKASIINPDEACELALNNENSLLNILEEIESYEADYLVLEVNETSIDAGLVKDIPFKVRALTNLNPKHNDELYTPDDYVKIKKSFFQNTEDDSICVFGLVDTTTRDQFNDFIKLNDNQKITFSTKYTCQLRNADYKNIDYLLYEMDNSLDGTIMSIRAKDELVNIKTPLILPHNSLNCLCAMAILEALNVLNLDIFSQCLENITIPGREEIIKINDRSIIIGTGISPALENFYQFRENGSDIKDIKIVCGSVGTGFHTWDKSLNQESFLNKRKEVRQFAMNYLKKYADYVYITSNDNAKEKPEDIAFELQSYLNNEVSSVIEVDRQMAIERAITESKPKDLIYIAGRGNRRIFCKTEATMELFTDLEVVRKVIKKLGWPEWNT